jgi:D-3-phosphoglycerate dehydrogenase
MRAGKWDRKTYVGTEIRGKTLGVIGLGPIGSEVARRGLGLDMRVLAHDPYVAEERIRSLGAEPVDFEGLLATSDFITVHVPMTATTKGMISTPQFALMKDGVRLLNVARGGIIDEAALAEAVKSGKVAGAAIDVYTAEPIDSAIRASSPRPTSGHPRPKHRNVLRWTSPNKSWTCSPAGRPVTPSTHRCSRLKR